MPHHHHVHRHVVERAPAPALTTENGIVLSVVYVTAQPTFTGVIGGYSTLSSDSSTSSSQSSQATVVASSQSPSLLSQSVATSTPLPKTTATSLSSHSLQSVISTAPTTLSSSIALATTSSAAVTSSVFYSASTTDTAVAGSATTATSSDSSPESQPSSSGMSTGGKIGLAVGIIVAIGAIAGLLLFVLAKKKKQQQAQHEKIDDEKGDFGAAPVPSSQASASPNAPRLSLRPVSKLAPDLIASNQQPNQGHMLTAISEKQPRNLTPSSAARPMGERPRTGDNPFQDPENPFMDPEKARGSASVHNATTIAPAGALVARSATASPASPVELPNPTADSFPLPQSPQVNNTAQNARAAPAPAAIAIPASARVELAAPSPVVAQGPGPETPAGNVYRILIDFKPTMEDELELRSGQLVRLLHEYDDGWALCIRLDRSQQGVVPRTCLAAKPSKPRPGPGPANGMVQPRSRPMTPQGRPGGPGPQGPTMNSPRAQGPPQSRTQSPILGRIQSPAPRPIKAGAFNQSPRPLSPGPQPHGQPQQRSMSPGPYGAGGPKPMAPAQSRRRSNSASAVSVRNKRGSPPGPSKLGPGSPSMTSDTPPGLAI